MSTPTEHVKLNEAMRRQHRMNRFTAHDNGHVLRAPTGIDIEDQPAEEAPVPMSPGKADGGAQGHVPQDPLAAINQAIRKAAGRG